MKTSSPQVLRLVVAALLSCAAGAASAQTLLGKNAPVFPIVIDQPGSYKLAANLVVAANNVRAINVTAPNVTIDLNGFSIVGPNTCSFTTKTCTQPFNAVAAGIQSTGANTTVMNGVVAGFAYVGVHLNARGGALRNLVLEHNAGAGAYLLDGRAESVTAQFNGHGLLSVSGLVVNSHSTRNFGFGFQIGSTMLIGSSAIGNGGFGVMGTSSAGVRESIFSGNGSQAIANAASMGNNLCNGVAC
jgi:hypothetical protein